MRRAVLEAVTFNVWIGQHPGALRSHVRELLSDLDWPEVAALQEAHRWDGRRLADYRTVSATDLARPEAAGCRLLVREDVRVIRRRLVRVDAEDGRWYGAKHDRWHAARTFVGATLETDAGDRADVLSAHRCPNNQHLNRHPYRAEHEALVEWLERREDRGHDGPVLVLADFNSSRLDPRPRVSVTGLRRRVDGVLGIRGIDGGLVVDGGLRHVRKLPHKYGSDGHRPVALTLTGGPQ